MINTVAHLSDVVSPSLALAEALTVELRRVAARVRHSWWHQLGQTARSALNNISEMDAELIRLTQLGHRSAPPAKELADRAHEAEALETAAMEVRAQIPEAPLYRLIARAGLNSLERDLFLLALAPEIDEGFARIFTAFRGPGQSRAAVDVGLAANILEPSDTAAESVRRALRNGAPLERLGLLDFWTQEGTRTKSPGRATLLKVPPPVISYLLELPIEDSALRDFVRADPPVLEQTRPFHSPAAHTRLAGLLGDRCCIPILEGTAPSARHELMRAACAEAGRPLLEVEVAEAPDGLSLDEVRALARLAWLKDATLLASLPAPLPNDSPKAKPWQRGLTELINRTLSQVAISREPGSALMEFPPSHRIALVPVPLPTVEEREHIWQAALGDVSASVLTLLACNYPLSPGEIFHAAGEARVLATARADPPTLVDAIDAIDAQFAPQLQTVGRRLRRTVQFDDLVLHPETRETLVEMEATVRLRHRVLDEWRFERLVRGRGVSALFYGDPGTGKTMAASAIAAAAGLPLYQIDTNQVVSKWVGETEKNLAEVFRAAESAHAILLFDEADAVFGKRTDVQSSTDRYANMQTNFLLTQIELFNGVSILTTNRESVMDQAFQRRLTFRIYFPMPEVVEREALWRCLLGDHDRVALERIDLRALAKRLVMSGGYIRNAILRGAYLAAASNRPLSTEILGQAAELVLRDAGKVI